MRLFYLIISSLFIINVYAGPHTVQRGETYEDIAKLYHVSLDELIKANEGTEAYFGLTIEVPLYTLVYDLSFSNLFRKLVSGVGLDPKKGKIFFQKAYNKQKKLSSYSGNSRISKEQNIRELYKKAIDYGNIDAIYQMARYKIHGEFYTHDSYPNFSQGINSDICEFTQGIEYAQIAAILGEHQKAAVELALACGNETSPIYNPYLCLSMLETYSKELSYHVEGLLCDMYEFGYGINKDYLNAYIYAVDSELVGSSTEKSRREKILDKIDSMSINFESARYGVGLDSEALLSIAYSYYVDNVMEPEGIFYLHRAARTKNADANWAMAGILDNQKYDDKYFSNSESQTLFFANVASDNGNEDAKKYLEAYEKYQRDLEEQKLQEELARQREKEEKKARRRQKWLNFANGMMQIAAQTYVAVEDYKQSVQYNVPTYSVPTTSFGQMTDSQFQSHNQLALEQIAQYTMNKTYSDWTGTPMIPTDMSAVNLGTDMSPGSPLWMWTQQQQINRTSTQYARMQTETKAFLKQQTDKIEQHIMEHPFEPIEGYYDADGNWISKEIILANKGTIETDTSSDSNIQKTDVVEKVHDYNRTRYGYRTCPSCNGSGECRYCNGKGIYREDIYGTSKISECPNCMSENGRKTGKCGRCMGKGQIYGLKL